MKQYVEELLLWNKNFNLIGRSTEEEIWNIHIEDSLEILPFLKKENYNTIVDIGSGGGLPAIPLSIMLPEKHFYLTEVNTKKLAFLTFVVKKLKLNISVININEGFLLNEECLVLSRAFSSLKNIKKWEEKYLLNPVKTFVMKGRLEKIEDELDEAKIVSYEIIKLKKGHLVIF
ncbi:MAG: 16S rRNA (guanine(527)-N(7))-methyltransferase RsmG [Brevinematia bacterium]